MFQFDSMIPFLLAAVIVILVFIAIAIHHRSRLRLKMKQRELDSVVADLNRRVSDEKSRADQAAQTADKTQQEMEKQKAIARIAASIGDEQANKLILFAKLADEFRTPLTLTVAPLENALLEKHGPLNPELRKQLDLALRNTRELMRLVNQFHDISKLQAGKLELIPCRIDLIQLVRNVVRLFEELADKREIELRFSAGIERMEAYVDLEKMEEVLYHLISNALRFTPKGGKVSVSIAQEEPKATAPEGLITISVKDTGKGIPKDDLSHLFTLFYRQEADETRAETPLRVGLALVREIISLHGGEIRVESELGQGTEFTLMIPKGKEHFRGFEIREDIEAREEMMAPSKTSVSSTARSSASATPAQSPRILIVEDNPDVRELLRDCLKDHFHVTEAVDGKDALDKASLAKPDLIISDIMMPGMDGFDLCRTVKADESLNHIPVILLTAKSSDVMKMEGLEAGADAYIPKPFSPGDLLEKIKSISRQRRET